MLDRRTKLTLTTIKAVLYHLRVPEVKKLKKGLGGSVRQPDRPMTAQQTRFRLSIYTDLEKSLLSVATREVNDEQDREELDFLREVLRTGSTRDKFRAVRCMEMLCARRDKMAMHAREKLVALMIAKIKANGAEAVAKIRAKADQPTHFNQAINFGRSPSEPLPPERQAVKDELESWIKEQEELYGSGCPSPT